jgi:hypothetical protein
MCNNYELTTPYRNGFHVIVVTLVVFGRVVIFGFVRRKSVWVYVATVDQSVDNTVAIINVTVGAPCTQRMRNP